MSNLQKKIFELLDKGKDVIDIKHELGIPIWQITKIIENPETILNDEDNKILELYQSYLYYLLNLLRNEIYYQILL